MFRRRDSNTTQHRWCIPRGRAHARHAKRPYLKLHLSAGGGVVKRMRLQGGALILTPTMLLFCHCSAEGLPLDGHAVRWNIGGCVTVDIETQPVSPTLDDLATLAAVAARLSYFPEAREVHLGDEPSLGPVLPSSAHSFGDNTTLISTLRQAEGAMEAFSASSEFENHPYATPGRCGTFGVKVVVYKDSWETRPEAGWERVIVLNSWDDAVDKGLGDLLKLAVDITRWEAAGSPGVEPP